MPRWNNIMIQGQEYVQKEEKMEELKKEKIDQVKEEYKMKNIDIRNEKECEEVVKIIKASYEEEEEFRENYEEEYIRWRLDRKSFDKELCIGVYINEKVLVGLICGMKKRYQINRNEVGLLEVEFLAVSKKFKGKGLGKMLIKELRNRAVGKGIQVGMYSSSKKNKKGRELYRERKYYRAMNIKKLLRTGYCEIPKKEDEEKIERYYKLPKKTTNKRFEKMKEGEEEEAYKLYKRYMEKYNFYEVLNKEEFKEEYMNKYVRTYVLKNEEGEIIDLISYYVTTSKIMKKKTKDKKIIKGNIFSYTSNNETAYRLIRDVMIASQEEEIDVFYISDVLENEMMIKELQYTEGKEKYSYLLNWKYNELKKYQVGKMKL